MADCDEPPTAPLTWAQRLKRVFEIDISLCSFCGGQLRVIADITDPALIGIILDHVHSRAGEPDFSIFGLRGDRDRIEALTAMGFNRIIFALPPADADTVMPLLDRYAELAGATNT